MNWFQNLFFTGGVAHSILVLALVIASGIALAKIKFKGITLGATWILFTGIIASHFGMVLDAEVAHFVKEFGLILFIYSIGMQMGPGFFASFKKGGIKMNSLAVMLVFLSVIVTLIIQVVTDTPMGTMIGVMSGAVTNTPGLGAAQQAFSANPEVTSTMASAYAVAYPLGAVGVILSILLLRKLMKVDIDGERSRMELANNSKESARMISVTVANSGIFGKTIYDLDRLIGRHFVVSRIRHTDGTVEMPTSRSTVSEGDIMLIVTSHSNIESIAAFLGRQVELEQVDWDSFDNNNLISRQILVTKSSVNGHTLGELNIRAQYGISITRVHRAGLDLVATPDIILQIGDNLTVVGTLASVDKAEQYFGNSQDQLNEPNLIPIFLGIFLGVLLGSMPIMFPGIPQPVKLGLAGGPLIIAILVSRFGPKYKLVTYSTLSANKMLRDLGISMFLAAVGLGSGSGFVEAIMSGGYWWILEGVIITVVPVIIVGLIARYAMKLDFFSISGLLCGSQTNPVALSFSNTTWGVPQIATAYATVYPLAMFFRILAAQILSVS